jgi:hypothetical protein
MHYSNVLRKKVFIVEFSEGGKKVEKKKCRKVAKL